MRNANVTVYQTARSTLWGKLGWILCGIVAVVCLVGVATNYDKLLQETTSRSAPCVDGDYKAPSDAKTLRGLVEHYAGMCSYKVVWNTKVDHVVDPNVFNAAGVLYGTRDFAGAVQNTLVKSVEMGLYQMPRLIGCFDEKAKTITVVEYDTVNAQKQCALAPKGW